MIDLSMMNSTVFNAQSAIASIEAGARRSSVYYTLKQYGVTVTGGRADSVGVGGLVIGGTHNLPSNDEAVLMSPRWIVLLHGSAWFRL